MTKPPPRFRTQDLVCIALFAVLISVSAWITVPLAVPFTFQTFAVFLTLMTLGGQRGLYAILVYLLMGLAGLPVFSGFQGGFGALLGAGGGYLMGFPVAAILYRWLRPVPDASRRADFLAALAGLLVCYVSGTLWFTWVYARSSGAPGLTTALSLCVFPFLVPDLIKLVLAAALARRLKPHLK